MHIPLPVGPVHVTLAEVTLHTVGCKLGLPWGGGTSLPTPHLAPAFSCREIRMVEAPIQGLREAGSPGPADMPGTACSGAWTRRWVTTDLADMAVGTECPCRLSWGRCGQKGSPSRLPCVCLQLVQVKAAVASGPGAQAGARGAHHHPVQVPGSHGGHLQSPSGSCLSVCHAGF